MWPLSSILIFVLLLQSHLLLASFFFLSSKQLFAYQCILRSTVKIKSPSNIPQMQKSMQLYYRQWIVLPIRISSVHVVHTCGLLALLLIGVWESLMKNKARMTRRDSIANMGYFTLVREWNSKYCFAASSLVCGSMYGWPAKDTSALLAATLQKEHFSL